MARLQEHEGPVMMAKTPTISKTIPTTITVMGGQLSMPRQSNLVRAWILYSIQQNGELKRSARADIVVQRLGRDCRTYKVVYSSIWIHHEVEQPRHPFRAYSY